MADGRFAITDTDKTGFKADEPDLVNEAGFGVVDDFVPAETVQEAVELVKIVGPEPLDQRVFREVAGVEGGIVH